MTKKNTKWAENCEISSLVKCIQLKKSFDVDATLTDDKLTLIAKVHFSTRSRSEFGVRLGNFSVLLPSRVTCVPSPTASGAFHILRRYNYGVFDPHPPASAKSSGWSAN